MVRRSIHPHRWAYKDIIFSRCESATRNSTATRYKQTQDSREITSSAQCSRPRMTRATNDNGNNVIIILQ